MTDHEKFSDIRPYRDDEVGPAMEEIRRSPILDFLRVGFPFSSPEVLMARMDGIDSVEKFQKRVMTVGVSYLIKTTTDGVTASGLERLLPGRSTPLSPTTVTLFWILRSWREPLLVTADIPCRWPSAITSLRPIG